jgi:uncharacterized membrane protein (UPF0127 family)
MSAWPATVPTMRLVTIVGPRGAVWRTEVPTTMRERSRGLRGRRLGPREAMLLEHCRSVQTIGMTVPITVVFLDRTWRAIRVDRARSGRIVVCRRARRVFECHIGADVRVGDVLRGG